jgi:hypothetical protein
MAPSRNHEVPIAALAADDDCVRALLELVEPRVAKGVVVAEPTASVFTEEDVRALFPDSVWLLRNAKGRVVCVFVVEVQLRWRPEKPLQWALVFGHLRRRFRCAVELVVVTGSPRVRAKLARGVAEDGGLTVRVRVVSARALIEASNGAASSNVRAFLLATGLRITEDEVSAEELEARIRDERARVGAEGFPEPLRDAFLACLHRLAPPNFEELKGLVMLTMDMLSNGVLIASPEGRKLLKQWGKLNRAEGRKEGRGEGREEGREEGRLLGKRDTLLSALARRFGALEPEARALVEATRDEARLDDALAALIDGLALGRILDRLRHAPSE